MDNNQTRSRARDNKKKRTNQLLIILLIVGLAFFLILIMPLMNKDKEKDQIANNDTPLINDENDQEVNDNHSSNNNTNTETNNENNDAENNDTENNESNDQENNEEEKHVMPSIQDAEKSEQIEIVDSDDDNIIESYVANWAPIGTTQSGEHNSVFDEGSDDRNEIGKAITAVTDLTEDDYILWWIGNDGFDKAFTDIEDKSNNNLYRIFYSWVDGKGWQVTKVDHIKQSEHKNKFSN